MLTLLAVRLSIISIHALREESDTLTDCQHCHKPIFQSTLSVRRATSSGVTIWSSPEISIHALREESDPVACLKLSPPYISIHALREESDSHLRQLTTGSRISIHALREESDPARLVACCHNRYFNPRSP